MEPGETPARYAIDFSEVSRNERFAIVLPRKREHLTGASSQCRSDPGLQSLIRSSVRIQPKQPCILPCPRPKGGATDDDPAIVVQRHGTH
jgi:hypothetical protein